MDGDYGRWLADIGKGFLNFVGWLVLALVILVIVVIVLVVMLVAK